MSDINDSSFERELRQAAIEHLRSAFAQIIPSIYLEIKEIVRNAVQNSPEYKSLIAGELRNLFGITDSTSVLQSIVDAVVTSVRITSLSPAGDILGGLRIDILLADMSEVLGVAGGSYISRSSSRNTDTLIPWLNWLLTAGDRIVILDFEAKTGKKNYSGTRTGSAVMVRPEKRPSQGFRVPAEFSGVIDNNWLTRALDSAVGPILSLLESAMGKI